MTTVLCHGCWDLLHLGHINHLQEARKYGDRLVVSVTDDSYVGKGIGRPHFNAEQRAAALRALSCVDEVVINAAADATPIIAKIRPEIYVKGVDYKHDTGASLAAERQAVEDVGGKVIFTDGEKFSSSRLINSERFSPEVVRYLEQAKADGFRDQILKAFEVADKLSIGFVGETIIDEYRYVRGLGRASKELMLAVVEVEEPEIFQGGVMAASKHADWPINQCITQFHPDIVKLRYVDIDFNRKVFDVYSRTRIDMFDLDRHDFVADLEAAVSECNVIVVLDFGHGLLGAQEQKILKRSNFLAVNAQTNAGNYGFNLVNKYHAPEFVCIDDPEARLAVGMPTEPIEVITGQLQKDVECGCVLVTHGRFGSFFRNGDVFGHAPAFTARGIDTMGAGDAVMATAAPLIAAGLRIDMAAFVGNIAGSIKTSIVGHRRHVRRQEIIQTVETLLA